METITGTATEIAILEWNVFHTSNYLFVLSRNNPIDRLFITILQRFS
jgi:hypothetical protein